MGTLESKQEPIPCEQKGWTAGFPGFSNRSIHLQ